MCNCRYVKAVWHEMSGKCFTAAQFSPKGESADDAGKKQENCFVYL